MPTPMLAEIDLVQVIIIVIAMMGGFIQWLWNVIQQARADAAHRRQPPPTAEERALREEAWRRQIGEGAPPRPAPTSTTPPPVNDPFATVRELFEQVKREAAEAAETARQPQRPQPAPPQPPPSRPAPAAARRGSVQRDLAGPPAAPARAARGSVAADLPPPVPTAPVVAAAPAAPTTPASAGRPWAALLGTPAALRQAFVVREILGPPKALQSSDGSTI